MSSSEPRRPASKSRKVHTNTRGATMRRTIYMLFAIPLTIAGTLTGGPANAHFVPAPCDFITGGGVVIGDSGQKDNFCAHGRGQKRHACGGPGTVDAALSPPARS